MTTGSSFKERFEKPSSTLTYEYENESIERVTKAIELYGK